MASSGTRTKARPLRVVLVDDDQVTREMLSEALTHSEWMVASFARAEDALFAIAARPPDLVVTDIALGPGFSGHDLARRLREEPSMAAVAIVAITGRVPPTQPLLRPFDAYLLKPVDLRALDPMLRTLVEERDAARRAKDDPQAR